MGSMLQNLLGNLNPNGTKKDGAKLPSSVLRFDSVLKSVKLNGPGALSEDRSVSLFERISFRYYMQSKKDGYGLQASPVGGQR